jgi:RecA/RadA recombinase
MEAAAAADAADRRAVAFDCVFPSAAALDAAATAAGGRGSDRRLRFGSAAVDYALGGGLPPRAVVEWNCGPHAAALSAALLFTCATDASRGHAVVVCLDRLSLRRARGVVVATGLEGPSVHVVDASVLAGPSAALGPPTVHDIVAVAATVTSAAARARKARPGAPLLVVVDGVASLTLDADWTPDVARTDAMLHLTRRLKAAAARYEATIVMLHVGPTSGRQQRRSTTGGAAASGGESTTGHARAAMRHGVHCRLVLEAMEGAGGWHLVVEKSAFCAAGAVPLLALLRNERLLAVVGPQ